MRIKTIFQFIYFGYKCTAQAVRDLLDPLVGGNENDNNRLELICSLYSLSFYHTAEVEAILQLVVFEGIINVRHIATCFQTVVLNLKK
jgi:hypothetical protein